jgi:hypothetical protein
MNLNHTDLLTATQVAWILGVSWKETLRLARRRVIPVAVPGKAPRFDAAAILSYIKSQQLQTM